MYTQTLKGVRNDAKLREVHILDSEVALRNCSESNERTYFNHIGEQCMLCARKTLYATDPEKVGTNPSDVCPHTL